MKTTNILIAALAFGLMCGTAGAQDHPQEPKTPRITNHQIKQQARIKQGVKSGELTKGETVRLEKEQAKIQMDKKAAKADGKVTTEERQNIRHKQKKASRDIKKLKHNDRVRR